MYKTKIGLEIHAQLLTETKQFCSCSADYFDNEQNLHICPVCMGQPGALPVLNKKSVELAVRAGLALNCIINKDSKFDRKNYFYPDMPKNYQITQYFKPICEEGFIIIEGNKKVRLNRIHMEEDTGKMLHQGDELASATESLIDYNRAGMPLIEIVTEPDIETPAQAREFMEKLRDILRYVDICSGDMEKGALRCDANISVYDPETGKSSNKVEVKNMNSFKFVEKALEFEAERLTAMMEKGEYVPRETRGWNLAAKSTFTMRSKEGEADYRYFPEPDLPPLILTEAYIEDVKKHLPELPDQKAERFAKEYSIPEYDAGVLSASRELANYYESCAKETGDGKFVSNWIMGEVLRLMKEDETATVDNLKVEPKHYKEMKELIDSGKISNKIAKDIFPEIYTTGKMPSEIVKEKGLEQLDDDNLIVEIAKKIIEANPGNVEKYKAGKTNLLGFFVGQVMKESKGKANPEKANKIITDLLQ